MENSLDARGSLPRPPHDIFQCLDKPLPRPSCPCRQRYDWTFKSGKCFIMFCFAMRN